MKMRMLPCHRSSHRPDIYSIVLVYPVASLVQCSLLRILPLNHVRESALHCKVHYLPQACVIGHFSLQPRSDLMPISWKSMLIMGHLYSPGLQHYLLCDLPGWKGPKLLFGLPALFYRDQAAIKANLGSSWVFEEWLLLNCPLEHISVAPWSTSLWLPSAPGCRKWDAEAVIQAQAG